MKNLTGYVSPEDVKMEYYAFLKTIATHILCKLAVGESARSLPLKSFVEKYKESDVPAIRKFANSLDEDFETIQEMIDSFPDQILLRQAILLLELNRESFDSIKNEGIDEVDALEFYLGLTQNIVRDFENYLLQHERLKENRRKRIDTPVEKEVALLATSFSLCLEGALN